MFKQPESQLCFAIQIELKRFVEFKICSQRHVILELSCHNQVPTM